MKIYFWAVGKGHESYVQEGVELFTKRISRYYPVEWRLFAPSKSSREAQMQKEEAVAILDAVGRDDVLVSLDERGQSWTSVELAGFIGHRADLSTRNLVFLIGGAYGLHESILQASTQRWSLSKLVFPHQLVRLILSEQIYRACTILRNEKYHHL